MNTLTRRITLLLVCAIILVVGLATLAVSTVYRGPRPEATIEPIARQMHLLADLAEERGQRLGVLGAHVAPEPASGRAREGLSRFLSRALAQTGTPRLAQVVRRPGEPYLTASIPLSDGRYLIAEMPEFRPPVDNARVLVGWIVLIIVGSIAISVFAARMITRPIAMIEKAIASIGPDGVLGLIPEAGSREMQATARALNRLSARLRQATESRMRLVAAAGHDLRTPMTRMRLRAEFLPDEDREKWLADLDELDRIADSAIQLVREEVNTDKREPIRLDRLLIDIVDELRAQGRDLDYVPVGRFWVEAGPLALTRALRNLLINAATHGKGARLKLEQQGDRVALTITDRGPGIAPELIEQVFEPFFRPDIARRKSVPGAGLGLAIAREIINRFGGTIEIANHPKGGLVQTVIFKAVKAPSNAY
ncbi:ATP-binding protein [Tianweitania sp.]|uniref:ATP-binding protein n=1 Tax=Tianweitania sp. TaxID=2021634 RepID=UPI00289B06DA|nr:ATP-binding protein [Tianweitania sp.]